MKKNSLKFSTLLGMGAFCAAMIVAPLTTNSTYAAMGMGVGGDVGGKGDSVYSNCDSPAVLNKLGVTLADIETIKLTDPNSLTAAVNSAKSQLPEYAKYEEITNKYFESLDSADVQNIEQTLMEDLGKAMGKDYVNAENPHVSFATSDAFSALKGYTEATQETKDAINAALTKANDAYKVAAKSFTDLIKAKGFTVDETIITNFKVVDENSSFNSIFDNLFNAVGGSNNGEGYKYTSVTTIIYNLDSAMGDATPYFIDLVCTTTKNFPNFTVNYGTAVNPFAAKLAATGPTLTSNNSAVRVSGKGLDPSYKLNVTEVTDKVKLTGTQYAASMHQAFFDINVMNSVNVKVTNTGDVVVFVKLPANMNAKNSFVVYYIPQAADGSYLTDKAEAIKGAKVENGWISFPTNHFSVYAIVEYPAGKAPGTGVVAANEVSARAASAKMLAGIATFATATGVVTVMYRRAARKEA